MCADLLLLLKFFNFSFKQIYIMKEEKNLKN